MDPKHAASYASELVIELLVWKHAVTLELPIDQMIAYCCHVSLVYYVFVIVLSSYICLWWSENFVWPNWFLSYAYCSYLLVLDRTNWKTNILTSLLIPYIFFSLPSLLFNIFRWSVITLFQWSQSLLYLYATNCMVMQRRDWEMDCFRCGCAAPFLPKKI